MGLKKSDDPKARKLALMRAAKTSAEAKHGMGGLPKGDGHKPKSITLPKMPWDDEPEVSSSVPSEERS